jgi:hypothetical protein
MDNICRCGYTAGAGPHPCHGNNYRCKRPAEQRFYNATAVSLSGMQMKLQVNDTFACDICWKEWEEYGQQG